ncbi:MAG: hypothetical protein ACQEP1_03225 [Nanobdellota archaeon]
MVKKCIICGEVASYCIKGSSEFYCEECAQENFSDINLLQGVEERAKAIHKLIEEKNEENKRE